MGVLLISLFVSSINNDSVFHSSSEEGVSGNIFLISPRKNMLWYSLEAPHLMSPNSIFRGEIRKKKSLFLAEKNLIGSYVFSVAS